MQKKQILRKILFYILFLAAGVLVNHIGKTIALRLQMPLWMDSIGTGVVACVLGPVCGALCGTINNIIYGFETPSSFAYILTSISIGMVTGICMKKGMFKHIFNTLTVSVIVAITVVVISTPLNILFWNGLPGNVWGDALYGMLTSKGWNRIVASVLGELFVDFPDKVVTILLTYLIIKMPVLQAIEAKKKGKAVTPVVSLLLLVAISAPLLLPGLPAQAAAAAETAADTQNYFSTLYAQTVYNSENGLAAGEANAIVETPDGYIWIGTYAGLYRYDGRNFTLMHFDSVKNVNCLYVDGRGRLWIGTNDKGVSLYADGSIVSVLDKSGGLPSNSIRCINEDAEGNFYIGTSASLCIVSEEESLTIRKVIPEVIYTNDISINRNGIAAVVTNAGTLVILDKLEVQGSYALDNSRVHYTSCLFNQQDELLVATSSNQIYYWNFSEQKPEQQSVIDTKSLSNVLSMYEDIENDVIWLCADNGIGYLEKGYRCVPLGTGTFTSSIDNMIKDYQGNLWFTSSRLGILKLTQTSFSNLYYQYGLSGKVVNSVVIWKGALYSGTDTGLDVVNMETQRKITNSLTNMLQNYRIRCLRVDSKNHLWIAIADGIGLLEVTPDGTVHSYGIEEGTVGERFRSVLELSNGTIVAAENTGIDFIRDGKVIATLGVEDGLTNPQILSLMERDSLTLLAGSDGDGIIIIRNNKVVGKITEQNGLPSGVILRMIPIAEGTIIVTSNSICFMNSDYKIRELKNFPYSNNFDVVAAPDGNLWVLGSAGIYIVDKAELLGGRRLNYELLDSRKGLKASLTANAWNCLDGETLYLSCNTGIYSINMNNYNIYKGNYRLMVDYLDEYDNSYAVNEGSVTQIAMDTTRIRIRPELLNYTLNDPYVSYYLEGYDTEETVVQQSSMADVIYTNLPAGTYVFHVSILDSTARSIMQRASYVIEKQPQFWEHTWFTAYLVFVCVLAIVYVTWLMTVLRSNKIIQKQKREIELARKQAEMGNETILAIAKTVDAKDVNTREHSERVSEYSVLIAQKLGWKKEEYENLRKIALLHDIGKIGIPDSILNKPSKLTDEEYALMKSHVLIGSEILKDFTIVDHVQDAVRYHHERYDGRGYMEGLKAEEIPLDSRIIGIADSFDAMTSNRIYRKRMDMGYVLDELKKGSGTQFDPLLVDIMLGLIEDGSINVEKRYRDEAVAQKEA